MRRGNGMRSAMRTAVRIGAAALAIAWGTARAEGPVPGEDLFKWGEYDSLIRMLEPVALRTGESATRRDSMARAKSLLFLGVAFCATGETERADRAFARAVELDPQVELDRFYVTEAIANRFQRTALRALRRQSGAAPNGTALPAGESPQTAPRRAAAAPAPAIAARSRHGWLWVGLGAAAAFAAAGSGYYLFLAGQDGGNRDQVTRIDLNQP